MFASFAHGFVAVLSLFLAALQVVAGPVDAPRYHLTDLGTLPGGLWVEPVALNNRGVVVGQALSTNRVNSPFLYHNEVLRELRLPDLPFHSARALDISDAGHIIVSVSVEEGQHVFLLSPQRTIDVTEQAGLEMYPVAVNNQGVVLAEAGRGSFTPIITVHRGTVRPVNLPNPLKRSFPADLNNAGMVLGVAFVGGPERFSSFIVQGERLSVLGPFYGVALNDRGDVAGVWEPEGYPRAMLHRKGVLVDVGPLPGDKQSWALALNNRGDVVGVSEGDGEVVRSFLFRNGNLHVLLNLVENRMGWELVSVVDINDRGQIVGVGYYLGDHRAFMLEVAAGDPKP